MEKLIIEPYRNNTGYVVKFVSLKNRLILSKVIKIFSRLIREEKKYMTLDFRNCKPPSFPNIICSISGLVDMYRHEYNLKVKMLITDNSYLDNTRLQSPYSFVKDEGLLKDDIFDKVIKFSDDKDVSNISENILHQLQTHVVCEDGILVASSWCLNEIMDNVLNHSESLSGYIMVQIHKKNKHLVFSIFDNGKGLYNSLKYTKYRPKTTIDAIKLAVKEGVTRDKELGQGNGMWGLHNIIEENGGILTIASGSAAMIFDYNSQDTKVFRNLPYASKIYNTTLVDFMVDFSKMLNVKKALKNYEPFEYISRELEKMETDYGKIVFLVKEHTIGTGTRSAGRKVRNALINIQKMDNKLILIDFNGISLGTSSYADEFIGKLSVIYGLDKFLMNFKIINCTQLMLDLINKAIEQRQKEHIVDNKTVIN